MSISVDALFDAAVDAAWALATSADIDTPRVGVAPACSPDCPGQCRCAACDLPVCDEHADRDDPVDTELSDCPAHGVMHLGCHTQVCTEVACWTDI